MASFFDVREKMNTPKAGSGSAAGTSAESMLTVSQVTKVIDKAIRAGVPMNLAVRGEISNFSLNRGSRHAYFTLKDADATLNCVMFRSEFERLRFMPEQGMELLASGGIRVFAAQGRYQLYVTALQPMGKGALELAFQQLRAKLEAEGLFAAERKKPLPKYPTRIAIVTSRQTAALQDMLKVLGRFPWITVSLTHVPVQGDDCGKQIAAGVQAVNRQAHAELILLGRGGGSLEDRCGFNDGSLARAIAASTIPIISGIGHEVDVSIADLVADHHAHTPTEAAQVATNWWRDVHNLLASSTQRLNRHMRSALLEAHHQLNGIERHEFFRRPTDFIDDLRMQLDDRQRSLLSAVQHQARLRAQKLQGFSDRLQRQTPAAQLQRCFDRLQNMQQNLLLDLQTRLRRESARLEKYSSRLATHHPRNTIALKMAHLNGVENRLQRATQAGLHRQTQRHAAMAVHLEAVSPQRVLERGYTVTRLKKSGAIVRSPNQLRENDRIITRFSDGESESVVEDPQQPKLFQ